MIVSVASKKIFWSFSINQNFSENQSQIKATIVSKPYFLKVFKEFFYIMYTLDFQGCLVQFQGFQGFQGPADTLG